MLVRRFAQHLREQNWFAVGIDFIVVVVGIFVGLQVDGWNEQRKERIRERVHLEQLLADTKRNIETATGIIDHHVELTDGLTLAVTALKRGRLEPDDASRFKWTILTLGQIPPVNFAMGAYDSLLASGDFALLDDQELKNQLVDLAATVEFEKELRSTVVSAFSLPRDYERRVVSAVPHPAGKGLLWQVDFDYMRDHADTFELIASMRYGHSAAAERMVLLRTKLEMLQERLEGILQSSVGESPVATAVD